MPLVCSHLSWSSADRSGLLLGSFLHWLCPWGQGPPPLWVSPSAKWASWRQPLRVPKRIRWDKHLLWLSKGEMVGWHHRHDGHEFEQVPGVGDGQGSLACCSPWCHKVLDMTERLNWWVSNHSQNVHVDRLAFSNTKNHPVEAFHHLGASYLIPLTSFVWRSHEGSCIIRELVRRPRMKRC